MKLAEVFTEKNPEKSLEYLKRAKNCADELNEPFYIAAANSALGDFYYDKKDFKNALMHYENAKKLAANNLTKDSIAKIELRIENIKKGSK